MIFYVIITFLWVLLLAGGLHIKDCKLHKDMLHNGMSFIDKEVLEVSKEISQIRGYKREKIICKRQSKKIASEAYP